MSEQFDEHGLPGEQGEQYDEHGPAGDQVYQVEVDQVEQAADEAPDPSDLAEAPSADPRVAEAVRRLDALSDLPPADHVEIYESVHRSLQESLAEASQPADGNPPRSAPS
ncbi:MAG: hypothetical protein ACXVWU_13960 [Nocardioides sp.]